MSNSSSGLGLVIGASFRLSMSGTSAFSDNLLIVPVGPRIVQPAGLGTVITVLVLQTQGSSTSGFGSVAYDPNNRSANRQCDLLIGNQIVGGANNQTYSTAQLGITNAGQLCSNMNINDPNK